MKVVRECPFPKPFSILNELYSEYQPDAGYPVNAPPNLTGTVFFRTPRLWKRSRFSDCHLEKSLCPNQWVRQLNKYMCTS